MVKMVYQRAEESHIDELYGKALKQVHRFSNSRCKNLDDATAPDLAKALFMSIKELEVLNAENERLREALGWFVNDSRFVVQVGGNPNVVPQMIEAARAALGDTK